MAEKAPRYSWFLIPLPSLLLVSLIALMISAYGWRVDPEPRYVASPRDQKSAPGPHTIVYTEGDIQHCDVRLEDIPDRPKFEDYPARRSISQAAQPLLNSRLARQFRTVLRDGVAQGPDFAGDSTIVEWGCGSSCHSWAIVEGRTGRVHAPPGDVQMTFGPSYFRDAGLYYQPNSRLLVVVGTSLWSSRPNRRADQWHDGATFLEWTGQSLRLLRAVTAEDLCAQHRGRLLA